MGDVIEITVSRFDALNSYEIPSEGIWFDIKSDEGSDAVVGLGSSLHKSWECWITFLSTGKVSIILKEDRSVKEKQLGYSLVDYTRFWFGRDKEEAWLGMGQSRDRLVSWSVPVEFKYITFCTPRRQSTTFRFEVPPLHLKLPKAPKMHKITGGELHWKSCDDQLPDGAVIGGDVDGENVYVIRARHRGSLTPGYFRPSKGVAFIPWGGAANEVNNFEALCGFDYEWKRASGHKIPISAFVAGHSEDNNEPLYIGRTLGSQEQFKYSLVPGKVQQSHKVCYVPYTREVAVKQYEVLTVPGLNIYCANEFIGPSLGSHRQQPLDDDIADILFNYSDSDDDDEDEDD